MTEFLEVEYQKLEKKNTSITGISNILNNIVQIKLNEPDLNSYKNHVSIDIKNYLMSLIELAELGPIKYDEIRERKINELLSQLNGDEKLYYLNFLIRQLQKSSFEDEIRLFQKLRIKTILVNSLKNILKIKSIMNFLIYFPLLNLFTLSVTLFIVALIFSLILLPAPIACFGFFDFTIMHQKVCDKYYFNHFINVFSSLIGVNDDFKIKPLNEFSMISLMFGKIFLFAYVIVFILNKFSDYMKR